MRRLGPLLALFLLVALTEAHGQEPRWALDGDGYLTVSELPPVLDEPVIEDHLTSGLTTSFLLRAGNRGGRPQGGARIDVRYELWDELFHVLTVATDGASERRVLANGEALRAWWRELGIRVLKIESHPSPGTSRVQFTLDVVPFSRSEQLDAQRWLTEAAARAGGEGAGRSPEKSEPAGGIAELLMATSIARRALLTLRWRVDLEALARPRPRHDGDPRP